VPIFAGAAFLAVRGAGAVVRRDELLDRLAADRDAYVITEVRDRALRDAAPDRRRHYAAHVRAALLRPPPGGFGPAAAELQALAAELEDETLTLDAACAVACGRLVDDPYGSPLLNPDLGPDALRARVRQIRSGFAARYVVPSGEIGGVTDVDRHVV
jgi:hypothetical protein